MEVRFRQVEKIRAGTGPALQMDRERAGGHIQAVEETQTNFTHCHCSAAPAELKEGGATLTSLSSLSRAWAFLGEPPKNGLSAFVCFKSFSSGP